MKHYAHTLRRDFLLSACVCACVCPQAGQGRERVRACAIGKWLKIDGGGSETETKLAEVAKEVWLHLLLLRRGQAGNRCPSEDDHTDI